MDIPDRVVVITGASSGIGEATARLAHARGVETGAEEIDLPRAW